MGRRHGQRKKCYGKREFPVGPCVEGWMRGALGLPRAGRTAYVRMVSVRVSKGVRRRRAALQGFAEGAIVALTRRRGKGSSRAVDGGGSVLTGGSSDRIVSC